MISLRSIPVAMALIALASGGSGLADVAAQQLPLRPAAAGGYPIVPVMEGWWVNEDGSRTISFGYVNRNREDVEVPIGERNSIEPAQLGGMQPTIFLRGRHHGVFTVTIPAGAGDSEMLWTIEANGEVTRVPGRTVATAYEMDLRPRPHGTVPPRVWFEEGGPVGQSPSGIVSRAVETARVGELLTLSVQVDDPSVRDPTDYRFGQALATTVSWFKHQGPPGEVEWVRHPSTPVPAAGGEAPTARQTPAPAPNVIQLAEGKGTAMVQVRFSAPGEYMLRVRADQFASAPDSGAGDQCCWTNGYVRVRVTQ